MRKTILLGLVLVIWISGGFKRVYSESVIHDTSAEFNGTFSDTQQVGDPAVKIVYDILPGAVSDSFGDGHDGSPAVSGTVNTYATCTGSSGATSLTTTLSAINGDIILIHQSSGTGAGQWELNRVLTDEGSTLTLGQPLSHSYGTGAQAVLVPQYTGGTLSGTVTCTAWNGSYGGIIALVSNGDLTVSGSLSVGMKGFVSHSTLTGSKQAGRQGESYADRNYSVSAAANENAGGGGPISGFDVAGAGGGGGNGATGSAGKPGQAHGSSNDVGVGGYGGSTAGNSSLTTATFGGSGGTGGVSAGGPNGYAGGTGGGFILVIAKNIVISGTVSANGGNGSGNSSSGSGGGGGAGGSILIKCQNATLGVTKVTSIGGAGGTGQNLWDNTLGYSTPVAGGAGGVGRIRVEYGSGGMTGSTNPTSSTAALAYKTSGTYLSGAVNITGCTSFVDLDWIAIGGTSVQFRTRTASTPEGLSSATWSDYLTSPGSQITSPPDEYIQYEASLEGTTSDSPTLNSVTINYIVNAYPVDFSLSAPSNHAITNDNTPTFTWESSTDPEGEPVTYAFQLSEDEAFSYPLYSEVSDITSSSYTPPEGYELADNSYYWKVIASDGEIETDSTETWKVTVDTEVPNTPEISTVLYDVTTGEITIMTGTGEDGSTLIFKDDNDNVISGDVVWDGEGNYTFTPTIPLNPNSTVYVVSEDDAGNSSQSDTGVIVFEYIKNIFKDDAVYHDDPTGNSMRMEKDTYYEFNIAVNDGDDPEPDEAVTVTAYLRKNSFYSGTQPKITLTGLGIDGTGGATDSMEVGADTWEQLSVTGTPNEQGVVTLKVETFSTVTGAAAWIDDISVSQ